MIYKLKPEQRVIWTDPENKEESFWIVGDNKEWLDAIWEDEDVTAIVHLTNEAGSEHEVMYDEIRPVENSVEIIKE